MEATPPTPPQPSSTDPDALKEAGNAAFKGRNYDKAIELYGSAIENAKSDEIKALCLSNRSAAYQAVKKWDEAVADAKECLKLKPGFARGYYRLAIAQKKSAKFREALETIQAGLKVAPNDANLKKARSGVLKKMKLGALTGSGGGGGGGITAERMQEIQADLGKLSKQRNQLRTKMLQMNHEAERAARESKRAILCEQQLSKVPKDAPLFAACGKMFIQSTRAETEKTLRETKETEAKNVTSSTKGKQVYAQKLKECEANIQEIVSSVKRR